jgi:hypothetical protein
MGSGPQGSGTRRREGSRRTRSAKNAKQAGGAAALDDQFDAEFERDSEDLERSGRILTRVLFFVFLGIAVLMVVVAVLTGTYTRAKLAREQSALGQVTTMTERKDTEGNSFYYPAVAFDVPDGGRYNVQLSEGSWPPSHRVGDLVTVLYDSQNPMDARIQSGGGTAALWTWTLVTGILAVAFALAAVLAWALGRQST